MKQIDDLPLEIHEKILSYLMTDPFTLHRIELVCQLWASIIRFFENKRGLNFRRIKVFNSNEIIIPFRSNLSAGHIEKYQFEKYKQILYIFNLIPILGWIFMVIHIKIKIIETTHELASHTFCTTRSLQNICWHYKRAQYNN